MFNAGRIGAIGVFEGPPHFFFYHYMDKYLPGRSKATIGKKILLDQFIACPMFSIQFFMGMAYLEGKSLSLCWQEFTKKFPTVYMVGLDLTLALDFSGFFRIGFTNLFEFHWFS